MTTKLVQTRTSVTKIRDRKGGDPIVCLTAYSAPIAHLLDPHVDLILVGDSAAMVVHGYENTLPITLDTLITHAVAVTRATSKSLIVLDLPFGSYEADPVQAFHSAARGLKEGGVGAVKVEGGVKMAATIAFLTARGVPVLGHIGLMPQQIQTTGGYRITGRKRESWDAIKADARAVEAAGAFAIVLEGMAEPLAVEITKELRIPTIGIGASAACDGQILVIDDMLGLSKGGTPPRFVKRYADLNSIISGAVCAYARDVRARTFPGAENTYSVDEA